MLLLAGVETSKDTALSRVNNALEIGAAAEKFELMVAAHGGPTDILQDYQSQLPKAALSLPIYPEQPGVIDRINVRDVGNAVIALGGGRNKRSDEIDHRVGFSEFAGIGASVNESQPIAIVHANDEEDFEIAKSIIRRAVSVSSQPPKTSNIVLDVIRQTRTGE